MIYIRKEGELIKNGFNFYPKNDPNNTGFIFRLGFITMWWRKGSDGQTHRGMCSQSGSEWTM